MNNPSPAAPSVGAEVSADSFDIEDSEDILGLARTLIDGRHLGILATVDASGVPELRWMSTLALDEFPIIYTLTSPESRKIEQIAKHPAVTWMFSNHDLTLILNLFGKARVLSDTQTLDRVWKKVRDKQHAYFLKEYSDSPGVAVIETTVESVECSSPRNGLRFSLQPKDLS